LRLSRFGGHLWRTPINSCNVCKEDHECISHRLFDWDSKNGRGQNRKILFLGGTDEFQDFANDSITRIFDHAFFYKNDKHYLISLILIL
jgi:hypothetical protein